MNYRNFSLYFASIGIKESFFLALYCLIPKSLNKNVNLYKYFNTKQVYLFSSARGALTAFLSANNIGKGDTVLLSSFTCLAVPTSVLACGALPIYADINTKTLNMDFSSIKRNIQENTKAIVIQHTMGITADDIEKVIQYAKEKNLLVIEDCALSIGSKKGNKKVGTYADAAIYSLELSKTISTGWGGILVNSNEKLSEKVEDFYAKLNYESLTTRFRKVLQIFLTGLFYSKYLYFFGKYIIAAFYRINLFKTSTPAVEYSGVVRKDFVSKLGGAQSFLANRQLKKLKKISEANDHNYKFLKNVIDKHGLTSIDITDMDDLIVSSRIPFFVLDKKNAIEWFSKRNIELGTWFDSNISDLKIFNFDKNLYSNVTRTSLHIVNFPCHSRLKKSDLKLIDLMINQFVYQNPSESNFNFFKVK